MVNGAFIAGAGFFGFFIGVIGTLLYLKRKQRKELEKLNLDTDLWNQINKEKENQKEVANAKKQSVESLRKQRREQLKSDTTLGTEESGSGSEESSTSSEVQPSKPRGNELPGDPNPLRD